MSHIPEPLTPADCDLRDFPAMLLDVVRLRDSDLAGLESAEAFRVAVLSWCVSWHQVPAGSLPNDDAQLCRLLGYGRDMATWLAVREAGGMKGWVLCADGRLYHPVVAEKANAALKAKAAQRNRTEAARVAKAEADAKRKAKGGTTQPALDVTLPAPTSAVPAPTVTVPAEALPTDDATTEVTDNVEITVTETVTGSKRREGKVRKEKKERELALSHARPREKRPAIPDWISDNPATSAAWNGFVEMRRKAKKPPTDRAVEMLVSKLDRFREQGIDVAAALDQSTLAGYADVYEPKQSTGSGRRDTGDRFSIYDQIAAARGYNQ